MHSIIIVIIALGLVVRAVVLSNVAGSSPDPSAGLAGLGLVSANDIWAVGGGSDRKRTRFKTIVLHWNGRMWR